MIERTKEQTENVKEKTKNKEQRTKIKDAFEKKQGGMMVVYKGKTFELEARTLRFTKEILVIAKILSNDFVLKEAVLQLVRSGGSVGANYREANEAISKKDRVHRLKIARKECKETTYWLELLRDYSLEKQQKIEFLIDESYQIRNILSAIIDKLS